MIKPFPRTRTPFSSAAAVLVSFLFASPLPVPAQTAQPTPGAPRVGRLVGRIVDAETGAGITDAGVQVVGTTLGASSGVDGRYAIANVPAGTITIHVRRIGFQPKSVTGLWLEPGQSLQQDVSLGSAAVQLTATVVTAAAERGTVSEALDKQRTAVGIVTSITTEQIARSPDSDAAQAVQRVSGVTVQDGRSVFVRGLGERYTTTTLNGVRMPSPEPEKRVVPLDLFPSGLLQSISTAKTFTPDLPGDFSGAQVDIQTREFPARRVVTYSASVGANDAAFGRTVLAAPRIGQEWLGIAGSERELPSAVTRFGNFRGGSVSQDDYNAMARSFRNAWTPRRQNGLTNQSFGVTVGGQDPVVGHPVGYVGSLTYSYGQEVRRDERTTNTREENGRAVINDEYRGSTGRTSVLWGGIANLSTLVGQRSRLQFNNTYNRTADNEAREDQGYNENLNAILRRSTLRFVERTVRSNQLRGEHALTDRQNLDWSLTSSGVTRREPDRSDLLYRVETDPATGDTLGLAYLGNSADASRRTFSELRENGYVGALNYRFGLGPVERRTDIKLGAMFRGTEREAVNDQYAIQNNGFLSFDERRLPAEALLGGRHFEAGDQIFQVNPLGAGGTYTADDRVTAGYAMIELPATQHLRLILGARVEHDRMEVLTEDNTGTDTLSVLDNTDVLPSAVLNLRLGEVQNVRFSVSQTLARPEYRELSPLTVREVLGNVGFQGNARLRRSLIQNVDLKWEWFPNPGELLSAGVFAKRFQDPIERVELSNPGDPIATVVNADGAENYGVELEARKGLGWLGERFTPLSYFVNATLMQSEIRVGNRDVTALSNPNRPMVGQAPYVLNTGLTYVSESGRTSATVLYNVVGKRIVRAALGNFADIYEMPRHMLDLSLRLPVTSTLSARLDGRNLLDSPYRVMQDDVSRERYQSGRVFSVGLSWRR